MNREFHDGVNVQEKATGSVSNGSEEKSYPCHSLSKSGLPSRSRKSAVILTAILCTALIALLAVYLIPMQGLHYAPLEEDVRPDSSQYTTVSVSGKSRISQSFQASVRYLGSMDLYLIHTPEEEKGNLVAEILDQRGKSVFRTETPLSEIPNAEWYKIGVHRNIPLHQTCTLVFSLETGEDTTKLTFVVIPQNLSLGKTGSLDLLTPSAGETASREAAADVITQRQSSDEAKSFEQESPQNGSLLVDFRYDIPASTYVCLCLLGLAVLAALFVIYGVAHGVSGFYARTGQTRLSEESSPASAPHGPADPVCSKFHLSGKLLSAASALMLAGAFLLMVPNFVYRLDNVSLDPSWRYFLNVAAEKGYVFGRNVFFTYGPLGFLYYLMNLHGGAQYWLGIAFWFLAALLHAGLFFAVFHLYRQSKISFAALLLSMAMYFAGYWTSDADIYLLYLFLLAVVVSGYGRRWSLFVSNGLLLVMFFGKFTGFTAAIPFLLLWSVGRAAWNHDRKAFLSGVPGLLAAPVCYLLYNPHPSELVEYVLGFLRISSGWMKTQQWEDSFKPRDWRTFFAILAAWILVLILALAADRAHAAAVLAICPALFSAYKYGVTAHGLSMAMRQTVMLFSAAILGLGSFGAGMFPERKSMPPEGNGMSSAKRDGITVSAPQEISSIITALCCLLIAGLQTATMGSNFGQMREDMQAKVHTLRSLDQSSIDLQSIFTHSLVPQDMIDEIVDATVTAYPFEVAYPAIWPELNFVYSPSVQNANEFIPWLDEKSAAFFRNDSTAPEYILFKSGTIYGHLEGLENPLTWDAICSNYQTVRTEDDVLLLRRKEHAEYEENERSLIRRDQQEASDGMTLTCPDGADFVVVHLDYSTAGKLKDFFYRAGPITITLQYSDGSSASGTIAVPNMASGFVLTYYPQDLASTAACLSADGSQTFPTITAFSFSGSGTACLRDTITVDWYQ